MSEINNKDELWRVIATGVLNEMAALMQTIAGISLDMLKQLNERQAFTHWAKVQFAQSLNFGFSEGTRGGLWDLVQVGADYDPHIATQDPPFVTGATVTGGDTLEADAQPEGYTTMVYQLPAAERTFTLIGTLAENPTPGAGNYVLVNAVTDPDSTSLPGLPSLFLTLTS